MELYKQSFDNISAKYDAYLSLIEHEKSMLDEYISQQEEKGYIVSTKYYEELSSQENQNISKLKAERDELIKARAAWVAAGGSTDSEDWYNMTQEINDTTLAIEQGETALLEYANAIRDIEWGVFDLIQERISNITEEAEFLIDLMSDDKLYDDNGQLTDKGMATMGLHGQNYNVHMNQADRYGQEIVALNTQIKADPYNQDLINRRDELLELQRESILAAQDEKEAIRDMVEEGIELELDALQEKIDKHNEALDSAKDLYDYQKKVKEQTKEIASLEKQMAAYAGDDSEEAKAKIQELKVSLEDAKEELKETEYEKYISDQQQLLDSLYLEYETVLNTRLDNIDALLSDMILEINANSSTINTTLTAEADKVGYTLTDSMQSIWNTGDGSIKSVLTTYGMDFSGKLTTVNNTLNSIHAAIIGVKNESDKEAKSNISPSNSSNNTTNDKKSTPTNTTKKTTTTTTKKSTEKTIKKGGKIKASGAKIYDYKGDKSGETQYYKKDPIYKVLKVDGSWIQARYHKLKSGVSGWFKKGDVKAYKTGTKSIEETMAAWTQEAGREFIIRPSDGAILTPLAKGDSVLNANASSNIWDMANNPTEFIKNNLDLGISGVPNNVNVQSNYTQTIENVNFDFKNVKNYDEILAQMQKDKNFEKLVLAMSVDRIAGKSSLAKGKAIR